MLKRPPLLKQGDKIGIVAPSRMITREQMYQAFEVFEEWGVEVACGDCLFKQYGYFAGTDEQRRSDLQQMLDASDLAAVFCARGGYGMTRIVDQLDFGALNQNPKWVIGFSDITALHIALNKAGIESIHGLMPVQYDYMGIEESLASLKKILFEGPMDYIVASKSNNKEGIAEGEIIGGNLSLVAESLGTPTEINTTGKILFLEEIDEYLYKVDRMFMQLRRAGKFDNIVGLIIGDFSQMKDTQIPFGKSIYELIRDHFQNANFPIAYDFPLGHEAHNLAVPCGRKVYMEVTQKQVHLKDVNS
ncbi:Muramoyltetrapeptide carboxypeptidase [Fulvivirga imtechensis AK7]|uniref:Muramoyltetrapeptide carboxypeptidase n=1 Tax=Fulvivirga imtechensis AK7 TaxID=1237149 RepID=L8JT46_9BACT|nr:LD-carboxypeptidase [Fulvivirga imtechensis]ELR71378.1 Muramoyltetrapeptide carboxypeptidase [Fulvivirga imtechensis AK7]